jgi:glyoxylase-like metal-dependent hydrolase (beta-lactamase superfamily II)
MTRRTTTAGLSELREIAPGVAYLRTLMVNLFFIHDPERPAGPWLLIDAGLQGFAGTIRRAAEARFGRPPAAIVLTHGHFDHVGSLHRLLQDWHVPVYAHPIELPNLSGTLPYAPPDPTVGGGLLALMSPFYPRGPYRVGAALRALPPDGRLPELSGWQWLHTPGHCAGHISLYRPSDSLVIAGDAVVTVRQESALAVLTQRREVRPPPAYYTTDWDAARSSVRTLAQLDPDILASGHGQPMNGEPLRRGLRHLAAHFDEERPRHGRYIGRPLLFDGPVAAPRDARVMAPDPWRWAAVALLATGAFLAVSTTRRRR